jgi:hypothetical protein
MSGVVDDGSQQEHCSSSPQTWFLKKQTRLVKNKRKITFKVKKELMTHCLHKKYPPSMAQFKCSKEEEVLTGFQFFIFSIFENLYFMNSI